jgi:hypothetical protein
MEIDVKASEGAAAGAIAFRVSNTTPVESINRVVEAAENVTLRGLSSAAVNQPASISAGRGAAGSFAAVDLYDPTFSQG